jgi:peptidoglycan/xylan/chitin deacetylase (PgdA/CDA1 family)
MDYKLIVRLLSSVTLGLWFPCHENLVAQGWIRINQLGYSPQSLKAAVLLTSESLPCERFALYNALTDEKVHDSHQIEKFDGWGSFTVSYRLDFSGFSAEGAYYVQAQGVKSPVFIISKTTWDGTADFLLRYMRQQRCGYNPFLHDSCHTYDGYILYHPLLDSSHMDVTGGWHDATDYLQYTATSANAVYQMLFAYQQYPWVFGDEFLANGEPGANGIADILDEARWGLDWLIKMNPDSGQMYNQIADDRDHQGFRLPNHDKVSYGRGPERPVYFCSGMPQGLLRYRNRSTGTASTAGKFSSAFALGAKTFRNIDPQFSQLLLKKSSAAFNFGLAGPGVCQTAPCTAPYFYEEDNWTDDMELAGGALYNLTGRKHYIEKAAAFGRQEIKTPWMGSDTARHYQWYPFLNMGHWEVSQSDTILAAEFSAYWKQGIDAVYQRGRNNPFLNGIPFIWCSNNLTVAMITQCHLYAKLTGDTTYNMMEASLRDWLFGCNPWGTSMVVGLPGYGDFPSNPHSSFSVLENYPLDGGLVDGPVYNSIFSNLKGIYLAGGDRYELFQSDVAVYHDDFADYSTNEPTMDGTADLTYYLAAMQAENGRGYAGQSGFITDRGAIVRGNPVKKQLCLVFTAHEFSDGFRSVTQALKKNKAKGAFFFTGDFYREHHHKSLIRQLIREGHYLGAHSDRHLLYCDWNERDSLLISHDQFIADLKSNYAAMEQFGIKPDRARFFLPPYEWYNDSIALWCKQYGLTLVNFTPGTGSNQDWTWPELGEPYRDSETIFRNILDYENGHENGLGGFILLTHPGPDPRRKDKLYDRLDDLLIELERRGYEFVTLESLLQDKILHK